MTEPQLCACKPPKFEAVWEKRRVSAKAQWWMSSKSKRPDTKRTKHYKCGNCGLRIDDADVRTAFAMAFFRPQDDKSKETLDGQKQD